MRKTLLLAALFTLVFGTMLLTINCSKDGNISSDSYLKEADSLFNADDYKPALGKYKLAAEKASQEDNNSTLVEAYSQIARCYLKEGNTGEGLTWLAKAREKASKEEPSGWSRYVGVWGRFEWQAEMARTGEINPEVPKAEAIFIDMYDYCLANELYSRAVDAAHMVALVAKKEDRLAWGLKGIKAAEEGHLDGWLGPLWNNHGWNLEDLGRYEEGLEALKKAREYHYKSSRELPKLVADWSVGYAYRKVGNIDSALSIMTDVIGRADSLYKEDPSTDYAEWVGSTNRELGEIALAQNRPDEALVYFRKAKDKLIEAGMPEWDKKSFTQLEDQISNLESNH